MGLGLCPSRDGAFFIVVLALLGDNPMQSKFAHHISLKGKFFCHICLVKGQDLKIMPKMVTQGGGGGYSDLVHQAC